MVDKYERYIGMTFETNRCGVCKIVSMRSQLDVTVEFEDGNTTKARMCNLRKGNVKNIYDKGLWLYGVGFNDLLANTGSKAEKEYRLWSSILDRVYGKVSSGCYKDVKVSEEWLKYSKFKESVKNVPNFKKFITDGWVIDKDLFSPVDEKLYSEQTCCFLPKELNSFLVGLGRSKGYHYCKRENKFVAQVQQGTGKVKHLGYYTNEAEAKEAYSIAKRERLLSHLEVYEDSLHDGVLEQLLTLYK